MCRHELITKIAHFMTKDELQNNIVIGATQGIRAYIYPLTMLHIRFHICQQTIQCAELTTIYV